MQKEAIKDLKVAIGAVAQLVEHPSRDPVWCNSTDMGSNHAAMVVGIKLSCTI